MTLGREIPFLSYNPAIAKWWKPLEIVHENALQQALPPLNAIEFPIPNGK